MNQQATDRRPDHDHDQQTGRLLEAWLRDEAPPHEPPVTMPNARARIALTRRRPALLIRDWWRWRPGRPDRRFPTMNSVTQLAAVAVLALSGLGLYMVVNDSPPSDSEAPAAVIDPEQVIAKVTGTIDGSISASDSIKLSEYAWEHRGLQGHGSVTADDPRLSGSIEMSFDWDDFRPQARRGAATKVFGLHLENDEGAWDGVVDGIRWPDEVYGDSHTTGLLVGSGAYDGLSAFIFMDGADHSYSFEGLIFPGAMPE